MSVFLKLKSWHRVLQLSVTVWLLGASAMATLAQIIAQQAPVNPRFVASQQTRLPRTVQTTGGYALGFVPSPLDRSYLAGRQLFPSRVAPPAQYDLRTQGRLTPVKDQSTSGCCWAFASDGSLESCLLPTASWDFSENNMKNTSGFDLDPNTGGGNFEMATAYLARWSGPITESADPYNPTSTTSPSGLTPVKHVQQVIYLPPRANATDNTNIKQAVMQYGAVAVTIDYQDSAFRTNTSAYYFSGTPQNNHAVCIVGWDDTYLATNFPTGTLPAGNGAFIVRNSWGTDWGANGYFYVSYYDTSIATQDVNAVFVDAEPTTNYARSYQYDPLGATAELGTGSTATFWGANVFTAAATESLAAVGLYAEEPGMSCQLSVYLAPNNGPLNTAGAATTQTVQLPNAGYSTIALGKSVPLTAGQKFSVVVKFVGVQYPYPLAIEEPISGYSSKASASAGQGYYSSNGTSWGDMTSYIPNTSVCIKAFTAGMTAQPPIAVDDDYLAITNTPLVIPAPGVLSNDSDPNGNPLTAILVSQPGNGTVTLNTNGSFTYTPKSGYYGPDSFVYLANNGATNSNNATVSLTVNAPPIAINDSYVTTENVPLTASAAQGVLVNDSDPDGDPFTANLVTPPSHGQLTLNKDGSFTYTPTTGYYGTDTFTYQDNDGNALSAIATVTLTVIAPPIANNDSYSMLQGSTLSVSAALGVLANDSDLNGYALSAFPLADPTNGTLSLHTDGSFSYTPAATFVGIDSFTYQTYNGHLYSPLATASITVNATGYEGDMNGDGQVGMDDWVAIGRIAAKLDATPTGGAFQRADCAPKATLGDGQIDLCDWVQAGRYAVGLDPLTPAGGPFAPDGTTTNNTATNVTSTTLGGATRTTVQLGNMVVGRNHTLTVPVILHALGNENALGFTVNFNASRLAFSGALAAGTVASAQMNINTSRQAAGSVGIALMLPPPGHFTAGQQTVITLTFTVPATAPCGITTLAFGDDILTRTLADPQANMLPATFVNGSVSIRL